jgi:cytochrome c
MTFPGIRDPGARQDLIAYLKAVAENSAPTATGKQEGGMMMGRSQRANLKRAGADSQVLSASHCRDTYTIRTANGTVHKVWEYNLRLKTDSSGDGPQPGKPVIVGSGMMGDRMSLVLASPAEISGFIKASCSRGLDLHGKVSDPESAGGARAPRP